MYQAFEEGIEVNGTTIKAIVDALKSLNFIVKKVFTDVGLPAPDDIDSEGWYSQQKWLDAFKLIETKAGPHTMMYIGEKIPENAHFPTNINDIEKALESIDIAYHINHRNVSGEILYDASNKSFLEGIGHYAWKKIPNEKKVIMTCENPYNCDFDRGIISKMAKTYQPQAKIIHDESKGCRKLGENSCTYIVMW